MWQPNPTLLLLPAPFLAGRASRASRASRAGGDERVKVLDGGVDRTPKSLSTLNPAVVRQTRTTLEDGASDTSDNFLDRISAAQFSQGGGSGVNSGARTPSTQGDATGGEQCFRKTMQLSLRWCS